MMSTTVGPFDQVPSDIIMTILVFSNSKDIISFSATSKRMKQLGDMPKVWKEICSTVCNVDWYQELICIVTSVQEAKDCNWKMFFSYLYKNGESWTKCNFQLLALFKRCQLPVSSINYLRMYCHVYYSNSPDSPKQEIPLSTENCRLDDNGMLEMSFKPISSQSLKDSVYFFYGEGRKFSKVELVMINRRADPHNQVLLSEVPFRASAKFNNGYHFGSNNGFFVKITTLGRTQLSHLAEYLGLSKDAFQIQKSITSSSHSASRYLDSEDLSWQLRSESNSTRPVSVGEVVDIMCKYPVEKLFQSAFSWLPTEIQPTELTD